jgi:Raf kinase inhibitor-like YbhB/YbcL family protein
VAASPGASVVPSPSPVGPAVNAPLLFSGEATPGFKLESSAFTDGGTLPAQYSCDGPGGGQSPPLSWSGAPSTAKAFVLVDQDPDAGAPNTITHWVVYNIPATVSEIEEGQPAQPTLPNGALQGLNVRRDIGYLGSCPPAGTPAHHYTFQLFALDGPLTVQPGATILDVQAAMTGHVVGQTKIVALFSH